MLKRGKTGCKCRYHPDKNKTLVEPPRKLLEDEHLALIPRSLAITKDAVISA